MSNNPTFHWLLPFTHTYCPRRYDGAELIIWMVVRLTRDGMMVWNSSVGRLPMLAASVWRCGNHPFIGHRDARDYMMMRKFGFHKFNVGVGNQKSFPGIPRVPETDVHQFFSLLLILVPPWSCRFTPGRFAGYGFPKSFFLMLHWRLELGWLYLSWHVQLCTHSCAHS